MRAVGPLTSLLVQHDQRADTRVLALRSTNKNTTCQFTVVFNTTSVVAKTVFWPLTFDCSLNSEQGTGWFTMAQGGAEKGNNENTLFSIILYCTAFCCMYPI